MLETPLNLDQSDPLAHARQHFHYPKDKDGKDKQYFTGHSLGLMPRQTAACIQQTLDEWSTLGSKGHVYGDPPWIGYDEVLKSPLAKMVGARNHEVSVMNALTVNLHLMLLSFYRPEKNKNKILILGNTFPSDRYAVASHLQSRGLDPQTCMLDLGPSSTEGLVSKADIDAIFETHGSNIALVLIEGVNYLTGQVMPMKYIAEKAHAHGAIMGLDLAHAVGNIQLHLHDWNIDFAAWCNYKYVNGGPGTVGAIYVHEKHLGKDTLRYAGWWGNDPKDRFLMKPTFEPVQSADAWQMSNGPVLLFSALRASLDLFDEIGMEVIVKKSQTMTSFLYAELSKRLGGRLDIITPEDPEQRGAQLSIVCHGMDRRLFDELYKEHVICDFREPNVIRVGLVSLYTRYQDASGFVDRLESCLDRLKS